MRETPRVCDHCNQPLPVGSPYRWCRAGWEAYQKASEELEARATQDLLVYGDWDVPGTKFNFVLVRTAKKFKARDLRKAIQALVNSFDPTRKGRRNVGWHWEGESVTPPWGRSIWDAFKELRYVWDGVELKRYVEPQPDSNVEVVNAGTDHKA